MTGRGVAQLVAHSLWERGVVSSSLAIPTILCLKFSMAGHLLEYNAYISPSLPFYPSIYNNSYIIRSPNGVHYVIMSLSWPFSTCLHIHTRKILISLKHKTTRKNSYVQKFNHHLPEFWPSMQWHRTGSTKNQQIQN